MEGLSKIGHTCFLASFEAPPQWVLDQHKNSHHWKLLEKKPGKFDFTLLRKLIKLLKIERIDVVHTHCEASALYAGIACKISRTPIVGTFHRSELRYYQPTLKNKLSAWLLTHCIAISNERKQRMVEQLGITENKITIIHGGVEPNESPEQLSTEEAQKKLKLSGKIIFSAGHLGPIKGHDDSINALALLKQSSPALFKQLHLYIAGDGSESDYQRLKDLIKKAQLTDKVTLLGQITNIMEWMQACDIFLQPSREEGFGLVFIEAGLCHKPTLATHVGGIPDIIINGETGYLVEPENPAMLANRLSELLTDTEKAKQICQQAYERTLEHFLLSNQIKKLEKVYVDLR